MTQSEMSAALAMFRTPTPHLEVGAFRDVLAGLPHAVPALCDVVRGLVLHPFDASLFGWEVPPDREASDGTLRGAQAKLRRILELDASDLTRPRPPERRLAAHCMNFAVLLAAFLRHQGVAARVRSGFVLRSAEHYNHWIVEYWRHEERRWVRVDVQMGREQRTAMNLTSDPTDLTRDAFLTASEVWASCRAGQTDARAYGWDWSRADAHGWPYLRAQLIFDVAAMFGVDAFPSVDRWGLMLVASPTLDDLRLLDRVAESANAGVAGIEALRASFKTDARLRPPDAVREARER